MSPVASLIAAAGCLVYVTGAAVLETVGYKMLNAGVSLALYRVEVAAEEFFEMLGASLILYAVLLLCLQLTKPVSAGAIIGARGSNAFAGSPYGCSSTVSTAHARADT